MRLRDGRHRCEGRVEVYEKGVWGTICDDFWDLREATVVCRQLECGKALAAPGYAWFGTGLGIIVMDDVHCHGNELRLNECSRRGQRRYNCAPSEAASVICSGTLGFMGDIKYEYLCLLLIMFVFFNYLEKS